MNTKIPRSTEQEILLTLKELLKFTKISAYPIIKNILESALDSNNKKIIYYLSDGKNSREQIVEKGKVAAGSVSNYWHEWEKMGIGETIPVNRGNRFKRSFDPEDFGIKISEKINGDN